MTVALTQAIVRDILGFWFDEHGPADWFGKNDAFDEQIRQRYLGIHEQLSAGTDPEGIENAETCLAAILVLDQFPRNMFRGTPGAFATDAQALELARQAVDRELDHILQKLQRVFLYMPFEHSEDLTDQETSCALFTEIGDEYYSDYARRHWEVIHRFGRFPHRNAILGRTSTDAEKEYLAAPGAGF